MRIAFILLATIIFSCKQSVPTEIYHTDTVFIPKYIDTCIVKNIPIPNNLKSINDSLTTQLFLAKYRIERVKYYLNICLKNPSQDKFLKGWIRRAVQ